VGTFVQGGFIAGSYNWDAVESPTTTPTNPYGSFVQLIFDGVYRDLAADVGTARHNLKTGTISLPTYSPRWTGK